jgi:hypothetical protein
VAQLYAVYMTIVPQVLTFTNHKTQLGKKKKKIYEIVRANFACQIHFQKSELNLAQISKNKK